MAQFSYESYAQQQAARKAAVTGNGGKKGPEAHFMGEFLKNDGDVAVVRFPYHSMEDISFETTHLVPYPGLKFNKRVRCEGVGKCPFCDQGVKVETRFFAKALVYVVGDDGDVKIVNAVWDRPAAFADIEIKGLIEEYGDLSEQLFKIKRTGSGTATRYMISVIVNKTVYNPAIYKADFSELDQVDPVRMLTKSLAQYEAASNGGVAPAVEVEAAPVAKPAPAPVAEPEPTYVAPQPAPAPVEQPRAARKYTF